jgi:hypothetical protein
MDTPHRGCFDVGTGGWLSVAIFVIWAGYGGLLPQWHGLLAVLKPGVTATEVSRHIGSTPFSRIR